MFGEKDLSSDLPCKGDEKGQNPVEKIGFSQKGMGFFRGSNSKMDLVGFSSSRSSTKPGNSGFQELTLSYLCDNPKLGLPQNGNISQKGKEVVLVSENPNQDEKWVERDFLNLSGSRGNSSKREVDEEFEERDNSSREKKPKLETLNLSLALPDVSLSLTASNALQNGDPQIRSKPCGSVQSLPQSMNTQTTCSNDFTAASLSYSYSHPFSHNPSCSLTRNSTENYEYSVGRDDQLWCGGEGTNGSVHSRFRPIGDAVLSIKRSKTLTLEGKSFVQLNLHKYMLVLPSNELPYESTRLGLDAQIAVADLEGYSGGAWTHQVLFQTVSYTKRRSSFNWCPPKIS
ncbi:hypothetical protein SLEP1_g24482 [Rubroshorea leprosula]|uniref:Uncharacterized protein n=1 Tax=Rubroshorea leprosula TaxID=152421 RepID=A0AAV5JT32_9ROSI|nr:hypothetical protein SLEP1_g24482 [Rubroshorea leprosula]